MAVIKKTLFPKNLDKFAVLVNDTQSDSKYFKITELPDTFTGGKNAFLIAGSEQLVPDTRIQIELKDSAGNIIYHEPGEGLISSSINGESFVAEYYEGVSKVVAVYVYPDTAYGPCTLTILGELSEYEDGNGILTPVPFDWENKYNVKWQKQIDVNPSLANTTKIRFYRRPTPTITELVEPIYRIESGSKLPTGINQSFADIKLSNLETFAGDVKRVKVFRTSEGTISDYDLIQDLLIESKELLTSFGLSGSVIGNTGIFTSETLKNYWNTGSLTAELTSSRVESGLKLSGSGLLTYTTSLDLKSTNTYELNLDAFYSSSTKSDLGLWVSYVSQSTTFSSSIGTLYGLNPTVNLLDSVFPFKIDKDYPTASLYLSQSQGEWHVGNVSLKLSQDTAFSPDEISFITTMPTLVGNETYNFKFEFYDVNNNYVPVAVTQSALFTGGTTGSAVDVDLIISTSVSISVSQSLEELYIVSSSISGTMTDYSSSASSSISSLSSSVSSSNSFILSSSLSKVQQLADGGYSGSFISGSIVGDTYIFSPVVGGVDGYFSNKFQVGSTNPIVLDATTSTRKIYVGTGTYNATNTGVYLDSTGKFSLKQKLVFDGDNLTIQGTLKVADGTSVATTTQLDGKINTGGAATDVNSNTTTISGGKIRTGIIESTGYAYSSGNYSTTGTQINLDNGLFRSKNFAIDSTGNAFFKGTLTIGSTDVTYVPPSTTDVNNAEKTAGKAGGWTIDSDSIYSGTKDTSGYSTTGITLYSGGSIHAPQFYIDTSGNAFFKGNITGASGTFSGTVSGATISGGTINVGPNRFIVDSSGNTTIAGNLSLNTGGTVSIRGYKFFNGGSCTSPSFFVDPGGDFVFRDFDSAGTIVGFIRGYTTITNCGQPIETTTRTIVHTALNGFTWGQYSGNFWATLNQTELNVTGDVVANTSDKRLKTNISNISSPLEKISKINGVYFNWNEKAKELNNKDTNKREVGFIAQEVQDVLPEIVSLAPFDTIEHTNQSKSGENYLTIQYEKIVPLLVESIKELKTIVENQSKEIEKLKQK